MLKYFGIKVTQKGVVTKTLPIVGGLIGGGWNYIEVSVVKKEQFHLLRQTKHSKLLIDTRLLCFSFFKARRYIE